MIDAAAFKVMGAMPVGLHPTGMVMYGGTLLIFNTYSDSISVIDTATRAVIRTIKAGTPVAPQASVLIDACATIHRSCPNAAEHGRTRPR